MLGPRALDGMAEGRGDLAAAFTALAGSLLGASDRGFGRDVSASLEGSGVALIGMPEDARAVPRPSDDGNEG